MMDERLYTMAHDYWIERVSFPHNLSPPQAVAQQTHPVYSVIKQNNTLSSRRQSQPTILHDVCSSTKSSAESDIPMTFSASTPSYNIQKPPCIPDATPMPTALLTDGFTTHSRQEQPSMATSSDSCTQPEEKTLEPSEETTSSCTILSEAITPKQFEALQHDFRSNGSTKICSPSRETDYLPTALQRPITTLQKPDFGTTASNLPSSAQTSVPALHQAAEENSSKTISKSTILSEAITPKQSEALPQDFRSTCSTRISSPSREKDDLPPARQKLTTLQKPGLGTTASPQHDPVPQFSRGNFSLSKWKNYLLPVRQRPYTTLKTGAEEKMNSFTLTRLDMNYNTLLFNNLTLNNTVYFHPTKFPKTTAKDWHFWSYSSIHFSWQHDRNQQYLVTNYFSLSIMQATRSSTRISRSTIASPKQSPKKPLLGNHSTNRPTSNISHEDTEYHSTLHHSETSFPTTSPGPSSKKKLTAAVTWTPTSKPLSHQSATTIAALTNLCFHLTWNSIMPYLTTYSHQQLNANTKLQKYYWELHQHQTSFILASPGSMSRQEASSPGQDGYIFHAARQPTVPAATKPPDTLVTVFITAQRPHRRPPDLQSTPDLLINIFILTIA